jgi:hypothetical protein
MNEPCFMLEEVCAERHKGVERAQTRTENDVRELWDAVGQVRTTVSALSNKIAFTVGGITVLINVVFLLLQVFVKGHTAP